MLKIKTVALAAALLLTSSVALADGVFDTTRYSLGFEMSLLNKTTYSSANTPDLNNFRASNNDSNLVIDKNKVGFNIFATAQFNQYLALELGYGIITKAEGTAQLQRTATNKITNTYLDALGYMPVAARVNLIGSIGVGLLKSKANVTAASFQDLSSLNNVKFGYRFGGGALFALTNNWGLRGMLRYQTGNKAFLKSVTSLAVGVLYTF